MTTWVCLLRGINVGGSQVLPMRDLVQILSQLGCERINTYIQSGNAVFRHDSSDGRSLAANIAHGIEGECGFQPAVLLLTVEQLDAVVDGLPFRGAIAQPNTLHAFFLDSHPSAPDVDALAGLKADSESFALGEGVFYLHAPDGIGRSKLARRAEKHLGVTATVRNWRTVIKLQSLVQQVDQ